VRLKGRSHRRYACSRRGGAERGIEAGGVEGVAELWAKTSDRWRKRAGLVGVEECVAAILPRSQVISGRFNAAS
jgi:hypothetical protein